MPLQVCRVASGGQFAYSAVRFISCTCPSCAGIVPGANLRLLVSGVEWCQCGGITDIRSVQGDGELAGVFTLNPLAGGFQGQPFWRSRVLAASVDVILRNGLEECVISYTGWRWGYWAASGSLVLYPGSIAVTAGTCQAFEEPGPPGLGVSQMNCVPPQLVSPGSSPVPCRDPNLNLCNAFFHPIGAGLTATISAL